MINLEEMKKDFVGFFKPGIEVSYSLIKTYRFCPLKYKLIYRDRWHIKQTPQISLGLSIHKTLEDFYNKPELSIDELNELMLDAQKQTYADGLDNQQLHSYMWAVKPHYYSTSLSFYNYPYMFGLLFGLGLYAQYLDNPDGFKKRYDELLSSTGLDGAAELAAGFGIDIRKSDFWRASLDVVRADIDKFEVLVEERVK